jgi:hypothetical protein
MARTQWTAAERLVAEQAVALHREVLAAMQAAPWGQGLAVTEAAVMQGGQEFLRNLLQQTLSAQPGAQQGGSAPNRVTAAKRRVSRPTRPRR